MTQSSELKDEERCYLREIGEGWTKRTATDTYYLPWSKQLAISRLLPVEQMFNVLIVHSIAIVMRDKGSIDWIVWNKNAQIFKYIHWELQYDSYSHAIRLTAIVSIRKRLFWGFYWLTLWGARTGERDCTIQSWVPKTHLGDGNGL